MTKMGPSDRADEAQMEMLEDKALARLVKERANQPTIQVGVKDLSVPDDACKGGGLQAKEMRGEHQVGSVPVEWVRPEAVTRKAETGADLLARILQHRDSIHCRTKAAFEASEGRKQYSSPRCTSPPA